MLLSGRVVDDRGAMRQRAHRTKGKLKGSLVLLQKNQSGVLVVLTSYLYIQESGLWEWPATMGLCIVIVQGHKALIHKSYRPMAISHGIDQRRKALR
jgi:hypothetical protein